MGQAWCKDRSSKTQDSKSPLDRVFLRCAHRIYPGLKEEGSMLGGATQKVTSSEIGYAGSPPRHMLAHGCSIDSIDRPFQPSDWVDVNLEVPSTPQASPIMTALPMETPIYENTTSSSGFPISRNIVPIPPPRRKKKNSTKLLPPKPNDRNDNSHGHDIEPLYSSVLPKIRDNSGNIGDENDAEKNAKAINDVKVNRTEKSLPNKLVPGWKSTEKVFSHPECPEVYSNRPKNTSTVSLPNYDEFETFRPDIDSDEGSVIEGHPSFQHNSNALRTAKSQSDVIIKGHNGIDDVDHPSKTTEQLTLGLGYASTPVKGSNEELRNPAMIDGWFLHADRYARFPGQQSDEGCRNTSNKSTAEVVTSFKPCASNDLFSESFILSHTDSVCNPKNEKKTNSLDRHRKFEPKKLHKRTLSSESEPFDIFNDKHSTIEPTFHHRSSPKLLTKSISEESFPSALMEDPDEVDFFDDKIVKDTKNEITKIREELEAVKIEVGTPPPSPEPIIKPELQENDHSLLLNMLKEEADESNLSSMTPSLTELEAALSDMLEKEEDQEKVGAYGSEDDYKPYIITKPLGKSVEPNIVPVIADETLVGIVGVHSLSSTDNNLSEKGDTLFDNFGSPMHSVLKNETDAPEKPSRMQRISFNPAHTSGTIPVPPRRRNRSKSNDPEDIFASNSHSNDRLI